ncbi:YfhO family protein [Limosilactobacillus pontis]
MKSIRTKYFLAFNIPVILLILIYLFLGIVPFGSKTIMSGDLLGQYVAINNYIRNNIIGITSLSELRNLLFSTSAGLGINFFPVLTYYAFSPLNLISLFFSRGTMPLFLN